MYILNLSENIGQISQATGSYVGALVLFSLTLFFVFVIGTTDVIYRKIRTIFYKKDATHKEAYSKDTDTNNSEFKISEDPEQDVISTWL